MLPHQEYRVKAVDPLYLFKQIKPQNNFPIVCSSLVRNMKDSFDIFAQQILDEINT